MARRPLSAYRARVGKLSASPITPIRASIKEVCNLVTPKRIPLDNKLELEIPTHAAAKIPTSKVIFFNEDIRPPEILLVISLVTSLVFDIVLYNSVWVFVVSLFCF